MRSLHEPEGFFVIAVVFAILSTSACTTLSDSQLEDKAYERQRLKEQYLSFRSACLKQDRRIYIDAQNRFPVSGIPHTGDKVYCY